MGLALLEDQNIAQIHRYTSWGSYTTQHNEFTQVLITEDVVTSQNIDFAT